MGPPERAVGDVFRHLSTPLHLVWGRVVLDIPAFCRELVEVFAEGYGRRSGQRSNVAQHRPEVAGASRYDEKVPHLVEPEDPR